MMEKRDFADMVIYFCQKVSEMNISRKYKMELLGMITAIEMKHDELVPKWTSFDIAVPKDYQKVLCTDNAERMMVGTYIENYGMTFPGYFEPIAWMPLPEPWRGDQ